jgi:hypothetical protein
VTEFTQLPLSERIKAYRELADKALWHAGVANASRRMVQPHAEPKLRSNRPRWDLGSGGFVSSKLRERRGSRVFTPVKRGENASGL